LKSLQIWAEGLDAMNHRNHWIPYTSVLPHNPYDSKKLAALVAGAESITGFIVTEVSVDKRILRKRLPRIGKSFNLGLR
jgi:hypothetical protein